jgi:hypothetical protein
VLAFVVIVNVDEPFPATDGGLKAYVAPDGSPVTFKATSPPNPYIEDTLTMYVAAVP